MPNTEPTAAPKRGRIAWIDALRGLAMAFVVLGHTFPVPEMPLRMWVYSFHMPLFFVVSGLTWRLPKTSFGAYAKRSAKNLLLPYLVLNVVVYCIKWVLRVTINLYENRGVVEPLIAFALGMDKNLPCIQSWFLPTLLLTQLLNYLIFRYIASERKRAALICALGVLALALSTLEIGPLPWHLAVVPIALVFHYAGHLWMEYKPYERMNLAVKLLLLCALFAAGWYLQSLNGRVSMNGNVYDNPALFFFAALCTSFAVVLLVILVLEKSRFLQGIGVCSIVYLGYHGFFTTIAKVYFPAVTSSDLGCVAAACVAVLILYPLAQLVTQYCPLLIGKLPARRKTTTSAA